MTHNKKNGLRKYAKRERAKLDIMSISLKMQSLLKNNSRYKKAKNILAFYPFGKELDFTELFSDKTKNWYLPRCIENRNLAFHKYQVGDELETSEWGVLEPFENKEKISVDDVDLIIIPALMADKRGYRLGYGAGFYDNYLKQLPKQALKIVPVAEKFFKNEIITDKWDEPVDAILTENALIESISVI